MDISKNQYRSTGGVSSRFLNSALLWCFEIICFWYNHEISCWIFSTFSVGGCWGQPMLHFWKLVDETQISKPPEPTRHHNAIKWSLQNLNFLFFLFRIIWLEAMISWEFELNTKHIQNLGFQTNHISSMT
jgi:hypothetical protein